MKKKHSMYLLLFLVLDQMSKYAISLWIAPKEHVRIIYDNLYFTNYHNQGAAWEMFSGNMLFFYLFSIVACIVLWLWYRQGNVKDTYSGMGIVCMIAGLLGNTIDRLLFQYVRDFIGINLGAFALPIFNIADVVLFIGVFFVLWETIQEYILEDMHEGKE